MTITPTTIPDIAPNLLIGFLFNKLRKKAGANCDTKLYASNNIATIVLPPSNVRSAAIIANMGTMTLATTLTWRSVASWRMDLYTFFEAKTEATFKITDPGTIAANSPPAPITPTNHGE